MDQCFSLLCLLASAWTTAFLVQGLVRKEDISFATPCRIMGVTLVTTKSQLNLTEAKEACSLLGLTLASKDHVTAARNSGFETCSYGWVDNVVLIIPRINANPKCGRNGVGVIAWSNAPSRKSGAYCYNSSDIHINSCDPKIPTKEPSVSGTQAETYTTEMTVGNNIYSALPTDKPESTPLTLKPTSAPTSVITSTSTSKKRRVICITEFLMETSTSMISSKTESLIENQTAFKNETNRFGGVPTALLVLALLFFAAATVLAVCYVKRYAKAFPFTNKNQQKEMIETKVVKEEKIDDCNSNEESKKFDQKPDDHKSPPKTTVRCLEAEV